MNELVEKFNYTIFNKVNRNEFVSSDVAVKFIKNTENMIRKSDCYKVIKKTLIEKYNLNHCMFLKNITIEDDPIEMHHGPIFNLYDLCEIASIFLIVNNESINIFDVVELVLDWHQDNIVLLLMVSKTTHQLIHNEKRSLRPFIDYKQSFGNIELFIERYSKYFTKKHSDKVIKYFSEYNNRLDNNISLDKELKIIYRRGE